MGKGVVHRKASSSWWNGTVTAECGLTVSSKDAVSAWFASVSCPGCRAAIRGGRT